MKSLFYYIITTLFTTKLKINSRLQQVFLVLIGTLEKGQQLLFHLLSSIARLLYQLHINRFIQFFLDSTLLSPLGDLLQADLESLVRSKLAPTRRIFICSLFYPCLFLQKARQKCHCCFYLLLSW